MIDEPQWIDVAEQRWREVEPLAEGWTGALCLGAVEHESQAGAPCIKWTFELDSGHIQDRITPMKGSGSKYAAEMCQALGLPRKGLRLGDAAGRRCRVLIKERDGWMNVVKARPA